MNPFPLPTHLQLAWGQVWAAHMVDMVVGWVMEAWVVMAVWAVWAECMEDTADTVDMAEWEVWEAWAGWG